MGIRLRLEHDICIPSKFTAAKARLVFLDQQKDSVVRLKCISGPERRLSIKRPAQSFDGDGVFGRWIYGEPSAGDWDIRLVVDRLEHSNEECSRGNGYSTLFAKCIPCGCIPFETRDMINRVVVITRSVYDAILSGNNIQDGMPVNADEKPESSPPLKYLAKLPSAHQLNYYVRPGGVNNEGIPDICSRFSEPMKKWPEVVAGITFGGLVPMASLNLVRIIQFTAQGGKSLGNDFFGELWNITVNIQDSTERHQLFGQYIEDCSKSREGRDIMRIRDPASVSMPRAAAAISRFSTILEYMTARNAAFAIDLTEGLDVTPTPHHKPMHRKRDRVRSNVFDACCQELTRSYLAAKK